MISLSREYARRRVAFGKLLKDHPLHVQTIARMEVRLSGAELKLLARRGQRSSAANEHSQPGPVCHSRMWKVFLPPWVYAAGNSHIRVGFDLAIDAASLLHFRLL